MLEFTFHFAWANRDSEWIQPHGLNPEGKCG